MAEQSAGEHGFTSTRSEESHVHPLWAGKPDTIANRTQASHVRPVRAAKICAGFADRQRGVVTRDQLLKAGVSRHVIDGLILQGGLHPLHRGIYVVGHRALPEFAREQAALFACGAPSLLCERSALHMWGIVESPPVEVHILTVGHHCGLRPGIRAHRIPQIDSRDTRTRHGLRVTSPSRALIEFAASASALQLEDAVAEGRALKLVKTGELEAAVDRAGRTRGAPQMRAFLRWEAGPGITRSRAERIFRRFLHEARLPQPRTNVPIAGVNADFLWEEERVILEVDSWQFHGHRGAFERDRKKDMILRDAGYDVIRITWRQFTEELMAVITHIARVLDRRSRAVAV